MGEPVELPLYTVVYTFLNQPSQCSWVKQNNTHKHVTHKLQLKVATRSKQA